MKRTCKGTTADEQPCKMAPLHDEQWCWNHHPDLAEQRAAARKRGGQNRRTPDPRAVPDDVDVEDAAAVISYVEEVIAATLAQENSTRRSKTLGYLLRVALDAQEQRWKEEDVEERLRALEQQQQ